MKALAPNAASGKVKLLNEGRVRYKSPARLPKLHEHMSLAQKLNLIRRRVHATGYAEYRHKDAPKPASRGFLKPNSRADHFKGEYVRPDSPFRATFTHQEIEAMWLALCTVFEFVGGNKSLLSRLCGCSLASVSGWQKSGRVSPFGAYRIGECPEIPLNRIQVRPDLSAKAWKEFDKQLPAIYAKQRSRAFKTAHRVGVDPE